MYGGATSQINVGCLLNIGNKLKLNQTPILAYLASHFPNHIRKKHSMTYCQNGIAQPEKTWRLTRENKAPSLA